MHLSQLLVLLVSAEREAGQGGSNAKQACMLPLCISIQPFYMFWQQVRVVFRGDCVGLQQAGVWNRLFDDTGHEEQEVLMSRLLCKVAVMPSFCGRLQSARLLAIFVHFLDLLCIFVFLRADLSIILALCHVCYQDVAEAWLVLNFSVVDKIVV